MPELTNLYDELTDQNTVVSLLLKGPPGSGKTWKAAHFPNPVIFNFDGNLSCLRKLSPERRKALRIVNPRSDLSGNPVPKIKTWDTFIAKLERVLAEPGKATVIFDSLTTLADALCDKILGTDSPAKRMEIQHFGDFSRYMKWLGEDVLCASDRDKVFIFCGHEAETSDGRLSLNLPTRIKDSFPLYFTDCWRTYVKTSISGDPDYRVRTIPGPNFECKRSLDVPKDFSWDQEGEKVIKLVYGETD